MSNQDGQTTPKMPFYQSIGTDPEKWKTIGVHALFMATLPIILAIVVYIGPPASSHSGVVQSAGLGLATQLLSPGEQVYRDTCMVCHGPDAMGVVGLGKPLVNSAYIRENNDAEVFRNIAEGRLPDDPANTTGVAMPARGAKGISDEQITDVVAYLRTLQDLSQPTASIEAWIKAKPEPSADAGEPVVGRDFFIANCSSCHGPNGEGMEGLGKPFTTSEFVKASTDKELMTMVKMGRPIWDAANTTGVDMPPKGGNPAMSEDELHDIITYIRSISTLD